MYTNLCSTLPHVLAEPILEKFKFDLNSDEPLDEQEIAGNKRLHEYCVESVEAVKKEREARVEEERVAYKAKKQEEEELRVQVSESTCVLSFSVYGLVTLTCFLIHKSSVKT